MAFELDLPDAELNPGGVRRHLADILVDVPGTTA